MEALLFFLCCNLHGSARSTDWLPRGLFGSYTHSVQNQLAIRDASRCLLTICSAHTAHDDVADQLGDRSGAGTIRGNLLEALDECSCTVRKQATENKR